LRSALGLYCVFSPFLIDFLMTNPDQQNQLQQKVFTYILNAQQPMRDTLEHLGALLGISQSAVYKRMQGKKLLDLHELSILIEHYQLPSTIFSAENNTDLNFTFPPLTQDAYDLTVYLQQIKARLQLISTDPQCQIIYLSTDLPFFYYFLHKEIAWFKMYTFQYNNSDKSIGQLPKISFSAIHPELETLFADIKTLYSQLDSQEIWTSRAFRVTLEQLRYFINANLFQHPEEIILLLDRLEDAADRLCQMVSENNKGLMVNQVTKGGKLDLSYNDFNRFNPIIMAKANGQSQLFLTYNLPNFLLCEDERFYRYTIKWIERIQKKSYSLSQTTDLQQIRFFNAAKETIRAERAKLLK